MSRADQIARQQARALAKFKDTIPATVTIDATNYTVALAPGSADLDTDDGLITVPEAFSFWISKADYSTRPEPKKRVTWNGKDFFIYKVSGEGAMHQNWEVSASRHRV